jgi:hypothetical protein
MGFIILVLALAILNSCLWFLLKLPVNLFVSGFIFVVSGFIFGLATVMLITWWEGN